MRFALTNHTVKLTAAVILIVIVALGAYYASTLGPKPVGQTTTQSATNQLSAQIVVGSTSYPTQGFSPLNNSQISGFYIGHQIYDCLVDERPDGTLVPNLASSWSANPDSSVWTFQLRRGVRFHDGVPLNASIVKGSLDLALPTTFGQLELAPYVKSIDVVDDYTVRFTLKTPYAGFPSVLGGPPGMIFNPSLYFQDRKNYGTFVNVGTGPFKFIQWIQHDRVILEANTNYWNASRIPKVKTFIWKYFSDANAMVLSLRNGEIDIAEREIPKSLAGTLAQDPNLKYVRNINAATYFLGINRRFKPLDNLYARKAIAYAVDRNQIANIMNATRADSLFPTPIFGDFNANAQKNFTYNPSYAKSLMAKAGYPNGYNGTLELYYPPQTFGPETNDVATIIQRNLADIGLKVDLKPVDSLTEGHIVNAQQAPLAMYNAGTLSSDPDFLATFTYGLNQLNSWSRWAFNNSTADNWVTQARVASSIQERVRLYRLIQNTFDSEPSHILFLYNTIRYVFMNKKVQGLTSVGVAIGYEIDWTQVYTRAS